MEGGGGTSPQILDLGLPILWDIRLKFGKNNIFGTEIVFPHSPLKTNPGASLHCL